MRRFLLLAIVGAALIGLSLAPSPVEAVIDNTSHDLTSPRQGACSYCHIPHKSAGSRLWPNDMSGQEAAYGEVGALCYYCHGSGGGASLPAAVQNNIMTTGPGAQATYSHGLTSTDVPPGGNNLANATDLPYYNRPSLQCTSCHDVHSDTNRPFLRAPYEELCQDCHSDRSVTSGPSATFGAWGLANVGVGNIYGSHPIGTDITGDVSGSPPDSPVSFGLTAYINMARSAQIDNWALGGHLSTSGVMCGSCHAPHGVDTDDGASPSAELWPSANLLVFRQATGTGDEATAANGNGEANNHLCEACHTHGATATIDAATNVAYVYTQWNSTAQGGTAAGTNYDKQPNPGATAFTHPVDDLGAQYAAGVSAFPAGWPVGSTPGPNVGPGPLCESCHTPHPKANVGRTTINASENSAILRDTAVNICGLCHTDAFVGHHPVGTGIMTARFTSLSSTGGNIGNADANLTCGDCHNGSNGAHNWATRGGLALDPDWVPANNDRGANDVVGNAGNAFPNDATGDSCKQCHMRTTEATGRHASPTNNSADGGADVTHAWRSSVSYQDLGDGSHFLGTPDNAAAVYGNGWFNGAALDVRTAIWPNVNTTEGFAKGGWSRWYNGAGNVGCQSCHEIEPDRNADNTALLLAYYNEGQAEADHQANNPSGFCTGCHGVQPGGGTPHPMTGSIISRAVTANRGTQTLLTTPAYHPETQPQGAYVGASAPTQNSGTSTFPGTHLMNCDSCHQPHDAPSSGASYVYEAPAANVTADAHADLDATNNPFRGRDTNNLRDETFCNQCHVY